MCYLTTSYFDIASIVDEWNVSVDRWWSVTERKTEVLGENLVPVPLYPSRQRKKNIPIYIYMCVCIYIFVCVCVNICVYAYVYIHVHICTCVCVCVCVCVYIYIYIYSLNTFILEFGILCQQLQINKTLHFKMHFMILLPYIHQREMQALSLR